MKFPITILLFVLCCFCNAATAQQTDSSRLGAATGTVRDSVNDIDLQLATVAIYRLADSGLLGYQLANTFGEFHVKQLPVGVKLKLVASFIGYANRSAIFMIGPDLVYELGNIHLERGERQLQEVTVTAYPPVRMNGDTLEFFADAFSVYKNAVVEDLLKKLPGMTVWGDGKITINGKKVSQVLVNGKPFFGGSSNVAIKNIPKDAVEKVQVYQVKDQPDIEQDSLTQVNIQLKRNRSSGVFGKVSAGMGTAERYEGDANINLFSKRSELGIVAGINNVNKVANNVNDLIEYSTFKSNGVSMDYQPDFSMQGTNRPLSGGLIFRSDFGEQYVPKQQNRLNGSYFIRDNNQLNSRELTVIHLLGRDSALQQRSSARTHSAGTMQDVNMRYDRKTDFRSYFLGVTYRSRLNDIMKSEVQRMFSPDSLIPASENKKEDQTNSSMNAISFEAGFSKFKPSVKPGDIDVKYLFSAKAERDVRSRLNDFNAVDDPDDDVSFNRRYYRQTRGMSHMLTASFGDLLKWLPRKNGFSNGLALKIMNVLHLDHLHEKNRANDVEPLNGEEVLNKNLTNNIRILTVNEQPSLVLVKSLKNELPDRYAKYWTFNINLQAQHFYQKAESDQLSQNIRRSYTRAVPGMSVRYSNLQTGEFLDVFKLSFNLFADYPSIEQLVGLVDSSDQSYIRFPNARLYESQRRELKFGYQHSSLRRKNAFRYEVDLTSGTTDNVFSDSTLIDNLGRGKYYTTNMDGALYLQLNGRIDKEWRFNTHHQLQLNLKTGWNMHRNPSYINGERNWSNNHTGNASMLINYTFNDLFAVFAESGVMLYRSRQEGASMQVFRTNNRFNRLAVSSSISPKLYMGTNVTLNRFTTSGFSASKFTLWNANIAYRFLKSDNLELKYAAMDLLRQNRSIINQSNNLMLSRGEANVLQQYYMVTLSYFPRKFGKRDD